MSSNGNLLDPSFGTLGTSFEDCESRARTVIKTCEDCEVLASTRRRLDLGPVVQNLDEQLAEIAELLATSKSGKKKTGVMFNMSLSSMFSKSPLSSSTRKKLEEWQEKAESMLESLRPRAGDIEVRELVGGSICGVYDPLQGDVIWKQKEGGGIFGVWNPIKEVIEWQHNYNHAIYGVWNPLEQEVEWRKKFKGTVAGVWNPETFQVEWSYCERGGVAGVWHEFNKEVCWKKKKGASVVGYYDQQREEPVWQIKDNVALCLIARNSAGDGFVTSCCNMPKWDTLD